MRKASWFALVVWCVVLGSACGNKTWKEFYQLDGQQQVLLAREGEPAYDSAEMEQIIAGLEAAPERARERDQALALAAKLKAERDRVRAERAAVAAAAVAPAAPVAPPPGVGASPTPLPVEPAAEAPSDAGEPIPTSPRMGMTEAQFMAAFGSCFGPGPKVSTEDGKPATSVQLNSQPACRTRFAPKEEATSEALYLFVDGKLVGTRATSVQETKKTLPPPPGSREPIVVDSGIEPVLTIPGMPTAPEAPAK